LQDYVFIEISVSEIGWGAVMNKVIGLKLTDKDKKLSKQIEDSGLSNSELIRNHYKNIN
jgi:hypothetical protein